MKTYLALGLLCCLLSLQGYSQIESDERALIEVEDGLSFKKDDIFLLNLRFRLQNRIGLTTNSGSDFGINQVEGRVRRARLRFDGYMLNPRISYYVQLSFSRADMDLVQDSIAQTVRDAILYYTINDNFYIGFGQSKLPGNRQRVISSGNLQFADRSFANARMTIDRDFGLFAYYSLRPATQLVIFKGAISTGDGRNSLISNNGMAYTGRVEWLPFGAFSDGGDYSEGDLFFEPTPKLSLAFTRSYNNKAQRTGGQLGKDLFEERDIETTILDGMFKYMGWALNGEYFHRRTPGMSAITTDVKGQRRFVTTGTAWNVQGSKMVSRVTEVATRFTRFNPDVEIASLDPERETVMLGLSRYLNGHRIKIQGHIGYEWLPEAPLSMTRDYWYTMVQVEFGI